MAIDLKKEVGEEHTRQAVLELIAANSLSKFGVAMVLTDLRKRCLFYWIAKDGIQECLFYFYFYFLKLITYMWA